jgi:hypothetical protein
MISFATPAGPPATPDRTRNVARWMIHVVLAAQLALAGVSRLPGCYRELADRLGTVADGLWLRWAGGALEPAGAAGLAVPCLFAAIALAVLGVVVVASLAHLVGLLAWAHWPPAGRCKAG